MVSKDLLVTLSPLHSCMNLKSFFKRQIMVARVYGIPVRIDYRWFAVFAISVVMIAVNAHRHPMQLGTLQLPPADDLAAWRACERNQRVRARSFASLSPARRRVSFFH